MRFNFGKNWQSFSKNALSDASIASARSYFFRLIGSFKLDGRKFLDVGFGQGLGLMIAAEAGANPCGIDIDPDNIRALDTTANYFPGIKKPEVKIASILDEQTIEAEHNTGGYDVVHSWGVLHHTGEMWRAVENCMYLTKPGGLFIVSIYNSHWSSPVWKIIKWSYNRSPIIIQKVILSIFYPIILLAKFAVTRDNPFKKERGMDFYHDVIDWVGGYPYEYASADEMRNFVTRHGFEQICFYPAQVPADCN